MRILLTAGPTREPIDPVRYLGNRSSGRMGVAIAEAAVLAGHEITAVTGPISVTFPTQGIERVRVETAAEMAGAVLAAWPEHDLLIMAAAVADYRPRVVSATKMSRASGVMTLELEPTPDIAAAACAVRRADQRVVGFSLEREGDEARAVAKMKAKGLDLIMFNALGTMDSADVSALLLYPDGRREAVGPVPKTGFAPVLIERAVRLFG